MRLPFVSVCVCADGWMGGLVCLFVCARRHQTIRFSPTVFTFTLDVTISSDFILFFISSSHISRSLSLLRFLFHLVSSLLLSLFYSQFTIHQCCRFQSKWQMEQKENEKIIHKNCQKCETHRNREEQKI